MPGEAVMPLRISKSSPGKHASPSHRALTEVSPMERRRNSPSWNQTTKKMVSPQESSPFDAPAMGSPRNFWHGKVASPSPFNENSYERPESPSMVRHRASIENLKKVSRVKNSSMFAREVQGEYDPSSPSASERPLASGRPLAAAVQSNNSFVGLNGFGSFTSLDSSILRENNHSPSRGHRRGESQSQIPNVNATLQNGASQISPSPSPTRQQSPTKSSLVQRGANTLPRNYDRGSIQFSDDEDGPKMSPPRALRRQAKSVTFDVAPPQVNEYEMATPDPSSVASGSREGSYDDYYDDEDGMYDIDRAMEVGNDDSFDASLEDTDKTPVVLPEHWQEVHQDDDEDEDSSLTAELEDPFQSNTEAHKTPSQEWNQYRTVSIDSDGDSRPLPPVPQILEDGGSRRNSGNVLDRVHSAQRSGPTFPAAATMSKSDLLNMKDKTSMSLEDRLRLMGIRDDSLEKTSLSPNSGDRERARLQRHGLGIHVHEDEDAQPAAEFTFSRISRESILKKVRSRNLDRDEVGLEGMASSPPPYDIDTLDPDMPLPSREVSEDQIIKEEEVSIVDLYSIPAAYAEEPEDLDGSVIHHSSSLQDSESVYSAHTSMFKTPMETLEIDPPTPTAERADSGPRNVFGAQSLGLPDMSSFLGGDGFQSSFHSYLGGSDETEKKNAHVSAEPTVMTSVHQYLARETTPDQLIDDEEPSTPGSVIHRPESGSSINTQVESFEIPEPIATIKAPGGSLKTRPSATPADFATMAATRRQVSGSMSVPPPVPEKSPKRLSFTGAPAESKVEAGDKDIDRAIAAHKKRRESFKMKLDLPSESIGDDLGLGLDKEFDRVIESSKVDLLSLHPNSFDPFFGTPDARHVRFNLGTGSTELALNASDGNANDGLANGDSHAKKGYLMRQNTKVVVAKRNFSNEKTDGGDAERPASADGVVMRTPSGNIRPLSMHERTKSWTTEPWNGKMRRKSLRSVDKKASAAASSGPPPPLPGQESVVTGGLDTVLEDQSMHIDDDWEDGVERGRLFVKVVGVKDLDLPLPQNERSWFQLTLDNGLHCVTTSRLELGRSAPIGQEFELVVLNDLEFQLTLQTQLTPPARFSTPEAQSQKLPKPTNKSTSTFSRLFSSPKKRREQEKLQQQQREEEERMNTQRRAAREAARRREGLTAWDLLHELVSEEDGSFGRSYVALKNHEEQCFGRPITVDMPLFNEWAVEDPHISSSVKSKRGAQAVLRRPPYQVGKLTLQLLYVPKPKAGSAAAAAKAEEDDGIPKSMNACVREMAAAERATTCEWEGFLSQQGGDCPYWRRRFFRLSAFDLTAYHETTMQRRVRISLAKATKLIDDKTSLVKGDGGVPKRGGRRKSAFAEEDQAYMFVEEGFRIRFANGEAIDFYADSPADKEGWMAALALVVGKSAVGGPGGVKGANGAETWTDIVLKRERMLKERVDKDNAAAAGGAGIVAPSAQQNGLGLGIGAAVTATSSSAVTGADGEATTARPRSQPGIPAGSSSTLSGGHAHHHHHHTAPRPGSFHPSSPSRVAPGTPNGSASSRPRSQLLASATSQAQLQKQQATLPGPAPGRLSSRRNQIKSMIF